MAPDTPDVADLADRIAAGDRRALARGITLVESGRDDHRALAAALIDRLPMRRDTLRIGLSGTPGVGKSTFIEAFGLHLTGLDHRVAVLAVDPSSARTGGSILGDKTRMERLARDPAAFIRPSPARSHLGGVARRTRETVALVEAAGFGVVLVETVGVGQSETTVADLTDLFVLLLAPAGGDALQGVKRGIMEMADLILVNKADGDLLAAALRTCADYAGALHLLRRRPQDPDGFPKASTVSALEGAGIAALWDDLQAIAAFRQTGGHRDRTRTAQARTAFEADLRAALLARLTARDGMAETIRAASDRVASGTQSAHAAVSAILGGLRD